MVRINKQNELWTLDYYFWNDTYQKWTWARNGFSSFHDLLKYVWFQNVWPMPSIEKTLGIDKVGIKIQRILKW